MVTASYTWGAGMVRQTRGSQVVYTHADWQRSIRVVTDENGQYNLCDLIDWYGYDILYIYEEQQAGYVQTYPVNPPYHTWMQPVAPSKPAGRPARGSRLTATWGPDRKEAS